MNVSTDKLDRSTNAETYSDSEPRPRPSAWNQSVEFTERQQWNADSHP